MFSSITSKSLRKTRGAFSLVEILIVIMIIAVLMAVAIPNLLSSRDTGADSAAKQLLTKVSVEFKSVGVTNESFSAINTAALATARIPGIQIVANNVAAGIVSGTNARSVSMGVSGGDLVATIVAQGGGKHCWAMVLNARGTQADNFIVGENATCTVDSITSWTAKKESPYAFPTV